MPTELPVLGRCDGCRFWRPTGARRGLTVPVGTCQRYAPRPTYDEPPGNDGGFYGVWWPQTSADEGCGEWKPPESP